MDEFGEQSTSGEIELPEQKKSKKVSHRVKSTVSRLLSKPDSSNEGDQEFNFPYLKIPNGIPSKEEHRYWLDNENEPSEVELKSFFGEHPDAIGRLVYCPEINKDVTDSWGLEGFEPGFLFVVAKRYSGKENIADATFLRRALGNPLHTPSGIDVPQVSNYAEFPQNKYVTQFITARRTPRTYQVVNEMLQSPKPPAIGQ